MSLDRSEPQTSPTLAFTGGGTGGHVYPAISVVQELQRKADGPSNDHLLWIGSKRGIERGILADTDIPYYAVPTGKLRRQLSLKNLFDVFRVLAGFLSSLAILRRKRPALLFSKGGYVSVPPVLAAKVLGIPVISHESDLDPGLATRINMRFSLKILVAYEDSRRFYPEHIRDRVVVVGNPIRLGVVDGDAAAGRASIGVPQSVPVLLVLGGSQGAMEINEMVWALLPDLLSRCWVVHQTGPGNAPSDEPAGFVGQGYVPREYIGEDYPDLLAAADLVVSRAGAGTLWEVAAAGKAAILVPKSDSSTRGDQVRNAEIFSKHEAALVLAGDEATSEGLAGCINRLLDSADERSQIGGRARTLARPDAAAKVANIIISTTGDTT